MARAEFMRTLKSDSRTALGLPIIWTLTVSIRPRSRDYGTLTVADAKTTVTAYLHRDRLDEVIEVAVLALDIVERRAKQPERRISMSYNSPSDSLETIAAWVPPDSQGAAQLVCSYRNARARVTLGRDGWQWLLTVLVELQRELASRKVSP